MMRALFSLLMYKVAPVRMGAMALHTYVNVESGHRMGVPMHVLRRVAEEALRTTRAAAQVERRLSSKHKPGVADELASYASQLQYSATAVVDIISGHVDAETARLRYPAINQIIETAPWLPGAS